MKKSIMSKIIILTIAFILVTFMCTSVFADDIPSLNGELNISNTPSGNEGNTQTPSNTIENVTNNIGGNTSTTNNNSSSYQESDTPLSNAGVESSVLMVSAFVVCAVIGIYTFKKLSDYSNI